jgi:hypothetical protein
MEVAQGFDGDEIALEVGRVVLAWSTLEASLAGLLTVLLMVDEGTGRVLIGGQSNRQMIETTSAIIEWRVGSGSAKPLPHDIKERFAAWGKTATALGLERNLAAHQAWTVDPRENRWSTMDLTSRASRQGARFDTITRDRLGPLTYEINASIAALAGIQIAVQGANQRIIVARREAESLSARLAARRHEGTPPDE